MKLSGKMKNTTGRRALAAAVTAWLAATPFSASAMTTEYVCHNGQPFVEMNFLEESDGVSIHTEKHRHEEGTFGY